MPFADHMQRNRFELKYIIDEPCARGVRDFIKPHLVHDRFARPEMQWAYPIYSIYLDNPSLDLYTATICGHKNRFKLRARYYDDNINHPIFLEIKRRVNDVILKDRAPIKRTSLVRLLRGATPRREDLSDPNDPEGYATLYEFCRLAGALRATGRTIVAYTREAWNAADNDEVRVTFDRKIAGSWFDDARPIAEALRVDRPWVFPPIDEDRNREPVVLELKFTGCYPIWMEELVRSFDLYRTCMAKYVNCVMAMGPRDGGLRHERWVAQQRREVLI
jgi:SPX domain protein involved in polyphosphate accumulation